MKTGGFLGDQGPALPRYSLVFYSIKDLCGGWGRGEREVREAWPGGFSPHCPPASPGALVA